MYGPVRTVVWQGSAGDCRPYADQASLPPSAGLVQGILGPDRCRFEVDGAHEPDCASAPTSNPAALSEYAST
jgi:hypothetical protein